MPRVLIYITFLAVVSLVFGDLRSQLSGQGIAVLFPGDAEYPSQSQAYNQRLTFQPAAVAFPSTAQQVSTLILAGSQNNLQVVSRSGGHSYIANGLGGKNGVLVVDMGNFTEITYNASNGHAIIGTGNRLGDVALALNNFGRAIPHGTCPYVGFGGHAGYGGYGFTSRMWGLTLDAIVSMDFVTSNGTIINNAYSTTPDLFWAVRGSLGSFGIATAIHVQTFPAPSSATVFQYSWNLNAADAATALANFQSFVLTNIPAAFAGEIDLGKGNSRGQVSFELVGGWYGAVNQFSSVISPFLAKMPSPSWSTITPGSYINSVTVLGGGGSLNTNLAPDTRDTFYAKSLMTPQASPISAAAFKAFTSYLATTGFNSDTNWFMQVELYGGPNSAINAVGADATAFAHRSSLFTIQFYASSSNGAPPYPADGFTFLDGAVNSIVNNSPVSWDYGAYTNYVDDRLSNWQQLYYGSHYPRLESLKQIWDPENIFMFPTSIEE